MDFTGRSANQSRTTQLRQLPRRIFDLPIGGYPAFVHLAVSHTHDQETQLIRVMALGRVREKPSCSFNREPLPPVHEDRVEGVHPDVAILIGDLKVIMSGIDNVHAVAGKHLQQEGPGGLRNGFASRDFRRAI